MKLQTKTKKTIASEILYWVVITIAVPFTAFVYNLFIDIYYIADEKYNNSKIEVFISDYHEKEALYEKSVDDTIQIIKNLRDKKVNNGTLKAKKGPTSAEALVYFKRKGLPEYPYTEYQDARSALILARRKYVSLDLQRLSFRSSDLWSYLLVIIGLNLLRYIYHAVKWSITTLESDEKVE